MCILLKADFTLLFLNEYFFPAVFIKLRQNCPFLYILVHVRSLMDRTEYRQESKGPLVESNQGHCSKDDNLGISGSTHRATQHYALSFLLQNITVVCFHPPIQNAKNKKKQMMSTFTISDNGPRQFLCFHCIRHP